MYYLVVGACIFAFLCFVFFVAGWGASGHGGPGWCSSRVGPPLGEKRVDDGGARQGQKLFPSSSVLLDRLSIL